MADEIDTGLFYFPLSLFRATARVYRNFERSLRDVYGEAAADRIRVPSFLRYGSWIGGDRDGNPNVTPEITWWTLVEHRRLALQTMFERANRLRLELTQSTRRIGFSDRFGDVLERLESAYPLTQYQKTRYTQEPYVRAFLCLETAISQALRQPEAAANLESTVRESVDAVRESLVQNRAEAVIGSGAFSQMHWHLNSFGSNLAALDVRQHQDQRGVLDDRAGDVALRRPAAAIVPRPRPGHAAGSDHARRADVRSRSHLDRESRGLVVRAAKRVHGHHGPEQRPASVAHRDFAAFFLQGELVEAGAGKHLLLGPKDRRTEDYITGRFG